MPAGCSKRFVRIAKQAIIWNLPAGVKPSSRETRMTLVSETLDVPEPAYEPEIVIRVGMSRPWTHYFDVAIHVSGAPEGELDFVMPVWTPGSYLVREFARNVQEFSSADAAGKNLRWEKISKNTWRVYAE